MLSRFINKPNFPKIRSFQGVNKMARKNSKKNTDGTAPVPPVEAASAALPTAATTEETNLKAKRTTAKPTIVKTEPRANLVPINLDEEIRRLAYLMSERRGFAPGHETEDWLAAEHEVRERYHQHSA
jgi:hypothetical protein